MNSAVSLVRKLSFSPSTPGVARTLPGMCSQRAAVLTKVSTRSSGPAVASNSALGEILLTSMDTDGVQTGFDCSLTREVSRAVKVPVIASGGAGKPEDFLRVFEDGEADAALAASIFHYGTYTVDDLKQYLEAEGVPVRRVRS